MIFTTMTQAAVLGLVLLLGLALGAALAPRGTKWRKRFEDERDAHAAYRHDAETKLRDTESLKTNRDAYVRDLETKNERLERDNEELRGARIPPPAPPAI